MTVNYDYDIVITYKSGQVTNITFQDLIKFLNIGDIPLHGAPIIRGGSPQVQTLISMIKAGNDDVAGIVAKFNGNPILTA